MAWRVQDRETSSLSKQGTLQSLATKQVARGPAASASPRNLLELLSLRPHPDPLIQKPNQLPRGSTFAGTDLDDTVGPGEQGGQLE